MRRLLIFVFSAVFVAGCSSPNERASSAPVIRMNLDAQENTIRINTVYADQFMAKTGVGVEFVKGPTNATDRLSQYLQFMGAKSPDIDIYQIDVIWPGALADHLIDLKPYFSNELSTFFPAIIENNTVDGRLVAIPWFGDAGMLYYRKDLLAKYGFPAPPKTWDELEAMARTVMDGERKAGNRDMWGYVWQGKAYEGLTCNAIEWQVSHGGGRIVETDGKVTMNNPKAIAALRRAAGWIGTISPKGVTTYQEEEARQIFQQGNSVFMRNWPYAWSLGNAADSPVKGKFDVTVLPSGGGGSAAALGGWQLAISKYSKRQREAIEFVRLMTSRDVQKDRALKASLLPTRMDLYSDPDLAAAIPFLAGMKDVFLNATPRPSTAAGFKYNEVSYRYFQNVHMVLTGERSPEEGAKIISTAVEKLM